MPHACPTHLESPSDVPTRCIPRCMASPKSPSLKTVGPPAPAAAGAPPPGVEAGAWVDPEGGAGPEAGPAGVAEGAERAQ